MISGRYPPVALPASPYAAALQRFCLSLEGAWEDYPWGDIVYKVGAKMFASMGGDDLQVTVKASLDDASVLVQQPGIEPAAYVGRYGWVTLQVRDEDSLRLAEELIAASYDLVRPRQRGKG
jgi:predicted DNA-binding protein (MmcQ/YjbR family)